MSNTVSFVSKEHLDWYWPSVKDKLEAGLFYCEGEITIDQLRYMVVSGVANLIIATDVDTDEIVGAMVIQIVAYPNIRTANIISIGGKGILNDVEDFKAVLAGLKRAGVSRLDGWCKPAQARLFKSKLGFKTPYQMITYKVGE